MKIVEKIKELRGIVSEAKRGGKTIGFVPTMGALHEGHYSLIKAAKEQTDFVVVSIFVNPAQFAPTEDIDKYPRTLDADAAGCRKFGVDVVFAPTAAEMYPSAFGRQSRRAEEQVSSRNCCDNPPAVSCSTVQLFNNNLTWVNVEKLTDTLCGKSRPGHFRGVATVCAKLFNIVQPDVAFFGQKDAQQSLIIQRLVTDLNMPLKIVVCPTVREKDGLAMSSRNRYLSKEERKDAALLYAALQGAEVLISAGLRDSRKVSGEMEKIINLSSRTKIDYISVLDAQTLEEVGEVKGRILIALAVKIGSARLIDNIVLNIE